MSFREQISTIINFKRGTHNCLFSTSVGEEGLDIPDCNIVVRFDLFNSVIQYIQSRGRARTQNSKYIIMRERDNAEHRRRLNQATCDSQILRKFCAALPEDRKISSFDAESYIRHQEFAHRHYIIPSTQAKLTFGQALAILGDFVGSLPHSDEYIPRAEYVVTSHDDRFICEVVLPESSPVRSKFGFPQQNKAAARSSAAFELCIELIDKKYIDEYLRSTLTKKLPVMRSARLAISANKCSEYAIHTKPEIWSRRGQPAELFATALVLVDASALGRPSYPLILLSREPLPELPEFPLFFGNGGKSPIRAIPLKGRMVPTDEDTEALKAFTLRIFDDIFSKEYEAEVSEVPYFLAPPTVGHTFDFSAITNPATAIDWEYLSSMKDVTFLEWDDDTPDDFFDSKFITDPYQGSRKLFTRGVRKDMKPLDPVPEGVPDPGHRSWKISSFEHNIKEYSVSAWAGSRLKRTWRDDQRVVEAEVVSLRRDLLDEWVEDDVQKNNICYVILEPLRVSAVSPENKV